MKSIEKKDYEFIANFKISMVIIFFIWFIHFVAKLFVGLQSFGIRPRTLDGLWGIFLSPFLHSQQGYGHILSNSSALFVLVFISLTLSRKLFFVSSLLIIALGGAGTWLFAESATLHIGASGWIYGLISFLFLTGIFHRNWKSILISLFVGMYYLLGTVSSLFQSLGQVILFQPETGISWEAHLFGFLAGIFSAWTFRKKS